MNRLRAFIWILLAPSMVTMSRANEQTVDYSRDVKPILHNHCIKCHGPDAQESDLRLDTAKAAITGGSLGESIVPGKSNLSILFQAITGKGDVGRMPPEDEEDPLTKFEIEILRKWIDSGAEYPQTEKPASGDKIKGDHWAFQPIVRDVPPQVRNIAWSENPLDRYVLAKLESKNISPSEEADRVTLLRRVSFDLIGLPPSPDEVATFLADAKPGAYERVVDRLLASPAYGERWGRHWLDLARYADSDGYTNDVPRVMWAYRDWVIDALNQNMPFDQFTIEQFAGDMLPGASLSQKIASGFHRNTQINHEGGSDAEQYRVEAVVDRVHTTGVVFLGLTLGCARCHEHKYDPISHREFYQFFAFLNNQDEPKLTVPVPGIDFEKREATRAKLAESQQALKRLEADSKKDPSSASKLKTEIDALSSRIAQLKKREKDLTKRAETTTYVMKERSKPRETFVMIRGDFLRKGRRVAAEVPEVLPPLADAAENPNRLDLARWLISDENPLTARVTVNRFWQQFFGRGIVATENDFGIQSSPPTHPKLLDFLAHELIHQNWNVKAIHRLIVTSATYRQSSHARADLVEIDPENLLLAKQNRLRLEAETIRDTALAVSGLLSHKMKGPSVFPPQPAGVMKMTRNPNRRWRVSPGEDRYRRGMYTYFWRSTPHPFLKLFNAPESNTACTRRDRSNTPLQALTLLNDESFIEAAQALAVKIQQTSQQESSSTTSPGELIKYAFRLCLAREPNEAETQTLINLYETERSDQEGINRQQKFTPYNWLTDRQNPQEFLAWTTIARTLMNLDEFITRE